MKSPTVHSMWTIRRTRPGTPTLDESDESDDVPSSTQRSTRDTTPVNIRALSLDDAPPSTRKRSSKSSKGNTPAGRALQYQCFGIQFKPMGNNKLPNRRAYDHFQCTTPLKPRSGVPRTAQAAEEAVKKGKLGSMYEYYARRHPHSTVWLPLKESEAVKIALQYQRLDTIQANEAKYSLRAKQYFFMEDETADLFSPEQCGSVHFELEWGPKPDEKALFTPPVLREATGTKLENFCSLPDCAYWLTLTQFREAHRGHVKDYTYVNSYARILAPYLTIEFKKEMKTMAVTEYQLAVSATLFLYNRMRLRCEYYYTGLDTTIDLDSIPPFCFRDLEHYCIAFAGATFKVFVARPKMNFKYWSTEEEVPWTGCELECLAELSAVNEKHVLEIQRWTNEIHCWGLGEYSLKLREDIEGIMRKQGWL